MIPLQLVSAAKLLAIHDSSSIVRNGRDPRPRTVERVLAYLEGCVQ